MTMQDDDAFEQLSEPASWSPKLPNTVYCFDT